MFGFWNSELEIKKSEHVSDCHTFKANKVSTKNEKHVFLVILIGS